MFDHRYLTPNSGINMEWFSDHVPNAAIALRVATSVPRTRSSTTNLPTAKWNGTEMYTQVRVDRIEPQPGYYRLHLTYIDDSHGKITRHPLTINSKNCGSWVRGSLGSTQVLLQSQNEAFQFSSALENAGVPTAIPWDLF
ncbi:MAG: hypothetical protein R3C03_14175 [Pirellulaceae bacterium]